MHPLSIRPFGLPSAASSSPVDLRRPRLTAYRCSLPGLTGFTASRRAGPDYQHHLPRSVPPEPGPRAGIRPRYSGLRVQGTASSPPSTTVGHPTTAAGPDAYENPRPQARTDGLSTIFSTRIQHADRERPKTPVSLPTQHPCAILPPSMLTPTTTHYFLPLTSPSILLPPSFFIDPPSFQT